jgi:hypothetical protein
MEFGRANGRSETPPEPYMHTGCRNADTLSPSHKKSKGKHEYIEGSTKGVGSVASASSNSVSSTLNASKSVLSTIDASTNSHAGCTRVFEFPRVPTASRGATPVSESMHLQPGHLGVGEIPRIPCASRGATPALSEYSQRSPSPDLYGGMSKHTVVIPQTTTHSTNVMKPCYMCHFAEEAICAQYTTFVMNETARSSRNQIARQVADDIVMRDLQAGRPPSEGASVADIERHIALHMLSPSVKVPELIRELDDVRRLMRASITNICPDTGAAIVDTGNVALYLRVVREQIQVYKMGDIAKLSLASAGLAPASVATDL